MSLENPCTSILWASYRNSLSSWETHRQHHLIGSFSLKTRDLNSPGENVDSIHLFSDFVKGNSCQKDYSIDYQTDLRHFIEQPWFLFHRSFAIRTPSTQAFSSPSLDSTWCEMSWRHRMRSAENAFWRHAIRWRHEISRQVGWVRRGRLGTRLDTIIFKLCLLALWIFVVSLTGIIRIKL